MHLLYQKTSKNAVMIRFVNYSVDINYKFTGSAQNPKDAVQIRFAAWERRGLSSNKGKHRCDEVVSSSVMIFGTIDFFARIYSNNQPI